MKDNKKAFTLVELLLVVILLGVVLTIALPSTSLVIEQSKVNASLISAKKYVTGIEYKFSNNQEKDEIDWLFVGNSKLSDVLDAGEYPQDGIVTIYNNKVVEANLCFFDKSVSYSKGEFSVDDSDKYCDYTANAIAQYIRINTENNINIENINYDELTIDTSVLTEETKVFGMEYINPEYIKYQKLLEENPVEAQKLELVPEKYNSNVGDIKLLKYEMELAKNDNKTVKNNLSFINNKVQKVVSSSDLYYNLNMDGYGTRMENQGSLGLCWAYTATSMLETTFHKKIDKNSTIQFSPRHLDYFSAYKAFDNAFDASYTESRELAGGGNFSYVMNNSFTGLAIQAVDAFKDNSTLDKKQIKEVYDNSKINYYPSKVSQVAFDNYSSTAVKIVKQEIINNGGIYASICSDGVEFDFSLRGRDNFKYIIKEDPKEKCGSHAVTIIGWDDSVNAWIAQNSWGDTHPKKYFYIDYEYDGIYPKLGVFMEISEKNWDNSYDSYNNFEPFTIDVPNPIVEGILMAGFYINKLDASSEKITNIGFYKDSSKYSNNLDYYVVHADNKQDCINVGTGILENKYTLNNNKIYDKDSNQIGFIVKSPEMLDFGYEINLINENMTFDKDICIFSSEVEHIPYLPKMSLFTKNVDSSATKVEMNIKEIGSSNISYMVDTLVNNKTGEVVKYSIIDSNGKDVYGTEEITITDNIIVNNISHAKFTLQSPYQYTITAIVDGKKSNSITINEGNLKEEKPIIENDTKPPVCTWYSADYKVTKKNDGIFILNCVDDLGFSDTNITKSDIKIPGLIFKKLKLKVYLVRGFLKSVSWTIKVERGFLSSGSSNLTLEAGAIADKNGNKNNAVTTKNITVSYK